jgi:hypothetical protein
LGRVEGYVWAKVVLEKGEEFRVRGKVPHPVVVIWKDQQEEGSKDKTRREGRCRLRIELLERNEGVSEEGEGRGERNLGAPGGGSLATLSRRDARPGRLLTTPGPLLL